MIWDTPIRLSLQYQHRKANGLGAGNNYFISLTDILDSNGNSIITDDAGKALSDDANEKS